MVYLEAPGFMELLGTGLGSLVSGIFQERSLWSKAVGERWNFSKWKDEGACDIALALRSSGCWGNVDFCPANLILLWIHIPMNCLLPLLASFHLCGPGNLISGQDCVSGVGVCFSALPSVCTLRLMTSVPAPI